MALTITIDAGPKYTREGKQKVVRGQIAFDSSYPTGGESLLAADIALRRITRFNCHDKSGFGFEYDYTNSKLMVYVQGVAIAAAGAATLDDYALTGVGASTARSIGLDSASTSPVLFGPQKEVANTTDLSTLTGVRFTAYGR